MTDFKTCDELLADFVGRFETCDELLQAVLGRVRELKGACEVRPSDDIITRQYGYEVVDRSGNSSFYRIKLSRLKVDPWAKSLADSHYRQHVTRELHAGRMPVRQP